MQDIRFITGTFLNPNNPADLKRSRETMLELIEALVKVNQRWLKQHPIGTGPQYTPPFYESGVIYRPEKTEEWRDIPTVLKAGWGDCEDLAAWRIAELRHMGQQAWPHIRWREKDGRTIYHALVKRADGRIEDPSSARGMANHPIVNHPVFLKQRKVAMLTGTDVILGACKGLTYSPLVGRGKRKRKGKRAWYRRAFRTARKGFRKVPWEKVHAVARIAGPIVAVAYPPAAPAIAGALALTYAASKNDPKALLAKKNIERAAAAGFPAAKEALQIMEVASAVKKNQAAVKMITAAKGGNRETMAQIALLKRSERTNPKAAAATSSLRAAMKGLTPEYQGKIQKAVSKARWMWPIEPPSTQEPMEPPTMRRRMSRYQAGL